MAKMAVTDLPDSAKMNRYPIRPKSWSPRCKSRLPGRIHSWNFDQDRFQPDHSAIPTSAPAVAWSLNPGSSVHADIFVALASPAVLLGSIIQSRPWPGGCLESERSFGAAKSWTNNHQARINQASTSAVVWHPSHLTILVRLSPTSARRCSTCASGPSLWLEQAGFAEHTFSWGRASLNTWRSRVGVHYVTLPSPCIGSQSTIAPSCAA